MEREKITSAAEPLSPPGAGRGDWRGRESWSGQLEGELEIRAGRGSWRDWVAVGELEGELKRELGAGGV